MRGWYWNVVRARLSNFNVHVKKPWVWALPPPVRMSSPSTWMHTFFTVLTCRLHPSPLLLPLLHWFSITLCNSPSPPVQCCVLEQRTLFNCSCSQYVVSHPWTRDLGKDRAQWWDVKMRRLRSPATTTPLSLISHLPFYLLPCSQTFSVPSCLSSGRGHRRNRDLSYILFTTINSVTVNSPQEH